MLKQNKLITMRKMSLNLKKKQLKATNFIRIYLKSSVVLKLNLYKVERDNLHFSIIQI
jgi:hypothetical protein